MLEFEYHWNDSMEIFKHSSFVRLEYFKRDFICRTLILIYSSILGLKVLSFELSWIIFSFILWLTSVTLFKVKDSLLICGVWSFHVKLQIRKTLLGPCEENPRVTTADSLNVIDKRTCQNIRENKIENKIKILNLYAWHFPIKWNIKGRETWVKCIHCTHFDVWI